METTIEVAGLRKRFGRTLALDGMTFTVSPGKVTGFIGPNGAGKSTTMRVILGLDKPDEGTALVNGRPYVSLRDPLTQVAALRKAGGYSLGMRQRLGIAAALLGDPPALTLDEPFNGMDPEGIVWMRGFLAALAAEGRTVLVSSHLMSELQDTAGHVVIVGRGKVIADRSVADLLASASGDRVTVRSSAGGDAMRALANAGAEVAATGPDALMVSGFSAERVVALMTAQAIPFAEVTAHRATLEEAYMELTRDAVEYRAESAGQAAR